MDVYEYREELHDSISRAASVNSTDPADEFLDVVTKILMDAEEIDDFISGHYEGETSRNASMQIDGYSVDEDDNTCNIFIVNYQGEYGDDSIRKEDIDTYFKKIRYFVLESVKTKMYWELEESTSEYDLAEYLYNNINLIQKFKFYLITDTFNKQRSKKINDDEINGIKVELNVWDINRIFEVISSDMAKENVEINLKDYGFEGIPCIKAMTCDAAKTDIMEMNEYNDLENVKITYTSYLAAIPGTVLEKLYDGYRSKLLEGNVRSFLSVRGKVNKSIQNTIKNCPDMFFAYNNGIAATATEVETEMTPEGLKITKINNLQIVNGGQTTASIANTLWNAKKDENIELDKIIVPMKLSVLEHSMAERIIPKISEYSNSQNKVDASDFFSNHPFHIRIEGYSRKIPMPSLNGNQFQQYWFYERTRGQYNQGRMKFKKGSSQYRQYQEKYPEANVIKLVDLAKYMEIYNGAPDLVSKGKQKIVSVFSTEIRDQWNKSPDQFNDYYYKRVVALAILFKTTDDIVKETDWYKTSKSYKANVIAYTLSIIFNYIHSLENPLEVDFIEIWNNQQIGYELRNQISLLCKDVYDFITDEERLTINVTEWCKKPSCWIRAKSKKWNITQNFLNSLKSKEEMESVKQEAKATRKLEDEADTINFIYSLGENYWKKVLEWNKTRQKLSPKELGIIIKLSNMSMNGFFPSERQAKVAYTARIKLNSEGMPLEF